ncbi:MAG: hypothetical protein U9N12_02250 [Euryarchaeota archaeon]|nr:hypothetical protein [Euryarchaeota archaeon]
MTDETEVCNLLRADVNADGRAGSLDALMILAMAEKILMAK